MKKIIVVLSLVLTASLFVYIGMVYGYLYSLRTSYEWNADTLRIIHSIDKSLQKKADCKECEEIIRLYMTSQTTALDGLYKSIKPVGFWQTFSSPGIVIGSLLFEENEIVLPSEILED